MKYIILTVLMSLIIACQKDPEPTPTYRCEEMTPENKVDGCKLGDWYNFDLQRCNSTLERCNK